MNLCYNNVILLRLISRSRIVMYWNFPSQIQLCHYHLHRMNSDNKILILGRRHATMIVRHLKVTIIIIRHLIVQRLHLIMILITGILVTLTSVHSINLHRDRDTPRSRRCRRYPSRRFLLLGVHVFLGDKFFASEAVASVVEDDVADRPAA